MARRHVVEELNEDQLDFVLRCFADGDNDREVCVKFEAAFKKEKLTLAKSSLHRWRKAAGDELIDRYRLARFQAKALVEQIGEEDKNKYQIAIENIEEQLLTATRRAIKENPSKMLLVRQREENFKLRREKLELERTKLAWDKEKFERSQSLSADRFKIASDTWTFILSYFLQNDPASADLLTNHSETLLNGLGEHIEKNQTS